MTHRRLYRLANNDFWPWPLLISVSLDADALLRSPQEKIPCCFVLFRLLFALVEQQEKEEKRKDDPTIAPTSFLWSPYYPNRYNFEVRRQELPCSLSMPQSKFSTHEDNHSMSLGRPHTAKATQAVYVGCRRREGHLYPSIVPIQDGRHSTRSRSKVGVRLDASLLSFFCFDMRLRM